MIRNLEMKFFTRVGKRNPKRKNQEPNTVSVLRDEPEKGIGTYPKEQSSVLALNKDWEFDLDKKALETQTRTCLPSR